MSHNIFYLSNTEDNKFFTRTCNVDNDYYLLKFQTSKIDPIQTR